MKQERKILKSAQIDVKDIESLLSQYEDLMYGQECGFGSIFDKAEFDKSAPYSIEYYRLREAVRSLKHES